jgi:hypothetical protein
MIFAAKESPDPSPCRKKPDRAKKTARQFLTGLSWCHPAELQVTDWSQPN